MIDAIHRFDPDDLYILARQVELLARESDKKPAIDAALQVCFGAVEESTWPADKVWDVAQEKEFADELLQAFQLRVDNGERPMPHGFQRMVSHMMHKETKRTLQSWWATFYPGEGARKFPRLLQQFARDDNDDSIYRGAIYRLLCDYGYYRLALRLFAKHQPSRLSAEEWAQIGRAYSGAEQRKKGREFMRDWRERPGVEMWLVANYISCLSRPNREQLAERWSSCHDALAGLPHDHCAKYIAHLEAEAAALRRDHVSLLDCWKTQRQYFDEVVERGEFFAPKDQHLLTEIPRLVRYIEEGRGIRATLLTWKLRGTSMLERLFSSDASETRFQMSRFGWWIFLLLLIQLMRQCGE